MDKTPYYLVTWSLIVIGTATQSVLFTTQAATALRTSGILVIAFLEVLLSASFFWNLRYETKILWLFPAVALLVIVAFLIAGITSLGMGM